MPKVVVYVRAEDARVIEAHSPKSLPEWVRDAVATAVANWKASHSEEAWRTGAPDERAS